MLCQKLHHAAYRCRDARETVEFYTEVLGLRFSHAVGGDHVPSTGEYDPHIHVFLELEDGSSIAFFEVPGAPGGMKDEQMHDWIQHFAFEVADRATLEQAKASMESRGMSVLGPTDHGFITSIYFHDPSGHRLELTCRTAGPDVLAGFAAEAPELLEVWDKTHDWSAAGAARDGLNVHR
jgi:catechol 2,3-dioxygenase-like lactoylglutathione lyase family enzyme